MISVIPALFERQMQYLASSGTPVVPLRTIRQNPGSAAPTFDDGYRNFVTAAWPVLRRFGFSATVFVVPEKVGSTND